MDDIRAEIGEDDELAEVSFSDAGRLLPEVRELHDRGNGEFPLLMQFWAYQGERKWMPWEDFSKYRGPPAE